MINQIFHWTGIVVWVLGILYLLVQAIAWLWQLWQEKKYRTWIYQVFEYFRFKKKFKVWRQEAKNFSYENWQAMKIHRAKFEGKVKGMKYRQRNLFRKYYVARFDEMLSSEEFKQWSNSDY